MDNFGAFCRPSSHSFTLSYGSELRKAGTEDFFGMTTSNPVERHHLQSTTENAMAACQAVLNTTELLEQIILNLEWQHIMVVQRVSKKWRAVCQASQNLKQVICFKADTTSRMTWRLYTGSLEQRGQIRHISDPIEWCALKRPAMLHPVAYGLLNTLRDKRFEAGETGFLYRIVKYKNGKEDLPMLRPQASWKKMQLTCPPSVHFSIFCTAISPPKWKRIGWGSTIVGGGEKIVRVENKDGVTVGDLACALFEHWYDCKSCPIAALNSSDAAQPMSTKATGYECLQWMQGDWGQ